MRKIIKLFNIRKRDVVSFFLFMVCPAMVGGLFYGLFTLTRHDQAGLAGVIGEFAADANLGCGQRYYPEKPGIVMFGVPCGALVKAQNPDNNAEVLVEVIGNRPMFRKDNGRVADVTVFTGRELGFNPKASAPQPLLVRVLEGEHAGLKQNLPFIAAFANQVPVYSTPYSRADTDTLTRNMLGECYLGKAMCMVASSQVALNRLHQRWNGKKTLHNVILDPNQFSWTRPEMPKPPTGGSDYVQVRKTLAEPFLNDRLSGELLGVQYAITKAANHYYAFDVMKTPKWGHRKGKLTPVPMENLKEIDLYHRFFKSRTDDIGTMIAMN